MSVSETRSNRWLARRLRAEPSQMASPPTALNASLIGSACLLGVFVGLRLMVAVFPLVGVPEVPAQLVKLTENGRGLFKPEYDLYVYLGGCLLSVVAPAGLLWVCQRTSQWRTGNDLPSETFQRAVACAWLGIVAIAVLLSGEWTSLAGPLPPVALALGSLATGLLLPFVLRASGSVRPDGGEPAESSSWKRDAWWLVGSAVLVNVILFVPDAARLAGKIYEAERFHHWDFFVMGPALQFRHGRALGTEGYAQYGLGFPLLAEGVSRIFPLRYDNLLRLGISLGCVYFIGLAILLRLILRNRLWAMIGLVLALELQTFTGVGPMPAATLWMCPSSTVLRYFFDIWFFLALWLHLHSGQVRWAIASGIALGFALTWVLDTGVYLAVVAILYSVIGLLKAGQHSPRGRNRAIATPLAILGAAAPIALAVWYRASRGSLGPEFFGGILEAVRNYPGGIGCLPFASLGDEYTLRFMIVSGTYLFAIARLLLKLVNREEPGRLDVFNACLGAYGLALLLLFVQRTHPCNLSHGIVPFAILASQGGLATVRWTSRWTLNPQRAVLIVSSATLVLVGAVLATNPNLRTYPGLIQTRWASSEARRVGLGKAVGVKGLSADHAAQAAQFRELTLRLASLQASGKRIAVISDFDPIYCLAAGVPPVDRYSPLAGHLLTEPLRKCVEKFGKTPFDFVCIEIDPFNPSVAAFREVLDRDYVLFEQHGACSILRRRTDARAVRLATTP
jgi:hypothetical protein